MIWLGIIARYLIYIENYGIWNQGVTLEYNFLWCSLYYNVVTTATLNKTRIKEHRVDEYVKLASLYDKQLSEHFPINFTKYKLMKTHLTREVAFKNWKVTKHWPTSTSSCMFRRKFIYSRYNPLSFFLILFSSTFSTSHSLSFSISFTSYLVTHFFFSYLHQLDYDLQSIISRSI